MSNDSKKKPSDSPSSKRRKRKTRQRTKQKSDKTQNCPKCGQQMDQIKGLGKVCNDCGWTITQKQKG